MKQATMTENDRVQIMENIIQETGGNVLAGNTATGHYLTRDRDGVYLLMLRTKSGRHLQVDWWPESQRKAAIDHFGFVSQYMKA